MRFLIVDSSALDRERIARVLHGAFPNADLVEAGSRAAYEQAMQDGCTDLVLIEYALDWGDGLTVLHEVKRRRPDVPVVLVTASGGEQLLIEALRAGVSDFVPKNRLDDELVSVIQRLSARSGVVSAAHENEGSQQAVVQALELERGRLSVVLDHLPVGVWIADINGQLVGKNEAADRIWAGEAPLLEGIEHYAEYTAWDAESGALLAPEDYPVAQTLRTGQPVAPVELNIRRFDGTLGRVLVSAAPIRDDHGLLTGVIGINMDVTEPRQAQEALRRSQERFRFVATNIPDILFFQDLDLCYTWIFNPADPLEESEVVGKTDFDLLPQEEAEELTAIKRQVLATGEGTRVEVQLSPGGITRRYEAVYEPSRDAEGQVVGLVSYSRDITERKETEATLRQSQMDLARAQEVGHIGSWRLDVRRNLLTWSEENYRIFGVPQGTPPTYEIFLAAVHPADRDDVDAQWQAALRGDPYDIEHRIVANGQVRWVRQKAYLEFDDGGAVAGGLGITQDITERKQVEEELRRSSEALAVERDQLAALVAELAQVNTRVEAAARFPAENPHPVLRIDREGVLLYANAASKPVLAQWQCEVGELVPVEWRAIVEYTLTQEEFVSADAEVQTRTFAFIAAPVTRAGYVNLYAHDVTVRKEAEEALRQSEQRFRLVASATKLGVYTRDLQTGEDSWSPEFLAIYGLEPGDPLELKDAIPAAVHPDDRDRVLAEARARFKRTADPDLSSEHRIVLPGGEVRWVLIRGRMDFDANDRAIATYGFAMDITERKEAEARLQRLSERLTAERQLLQTIYDTVPVMFAIYDPAIKTITFNQHFEDVTGWTDEDVAHNDPMELVYPNPEYRAEVAAYMQSLQPGFKDLQMTGKDGGVIESSWANMKLPDGRQIGIGIDIRERKQEERRQAFRVALGERLRSLQAPTEILDTAAEMLGRHLSVSRVGYAEVDVVADRLVMRDWTDGSVASSAGEYKVSDWGADLIATYRRGEVWRVDNVAQDPRPGVRDYAAAYRALEIQSAIGVPLVRGGEWVALIFMTENHARTWTQAEIDMIRDLAEHTWEAVERGRAEQALAHYVAELEELNEANRMLLREVNHRVKNNLTAIMGLILMEQTRLRREMEQDDIGNGRVGDRVLASLKDLNERVRSLATVHTLLSASRWRPLSVLDLAEKVVGTAIPVSGLSRDEADITIEGEAVYVTPQQAHNLALVLSELTINTIKYGRAEDRMRITVEVGMDDGDVHVVYRNNGPDYPDHVLNGQGRSVGLGLVNTLVTHSLAGTWSIYNERGAVTEIRFPRVEVVTEEASNEQAS